MANREIIEKVNKELRYGDKAEIAQMTKLSKFTVNRFFNGKEQELVEDTHVKIMNAALLLIEERQNSSKELDRKLNDLLP